MTTANRWINGDDPDSPLESYRYLTGVWGKTGEPYSYMGEGYSYSHTGDPVTGTGWLDEGPNDRRVLAATGPVTLLPGDSQCVVFKMAVARGADRLTSITLLRQNIADNPWAPVAGTMTVSTDTVEYTSTTPITIDVGSFGSVAISDIVPASLGLNNRLAPDSVTVVGSAYRLWFSPESILRYAGPTDSLRFFVNGHTNLGRDVYSLGDLALKPAPMGDVNGDGALNITDLQALVDYVFYFGPEPKWPHAADAHCGTGKRFTLTDLTVLVGYLFMSLPEPTVCDYWLRQ